jgi:hypothetical protein
MSTGKHHIVYCDSDGEEKVWSGYASRPEPDTNTVGSKLQLPSLQQEQLWDWAFDQQVPYAAYQSEQQTQDPAEQQQADASAEDSAAEPAKKKRCRSTTSKPAKKQHRSVDSKRSRPNAVSRRRPTLEPLEQPLQVLLRHVFFLNGEKSKYVSLGYYPARFCRVLIEFGGAHLSPIIIDDQHLSTLSEHLPK